MTYERIFPTDRHGNPLGPSREEIVRCRDCRFSLAHGNGCGRNHDIFDAKPDGYCAWGARADT